MLRGISKNNGYYRITLNEVPQKGKRSILINFPFSLDLKKNNVTILVIKTVPLIRHEIFP